jgi:predicted AlkP superfamily pyrophosphatase or phosphodiesterase
MKKFLLVVLAFFSAISGCNNQPNQSEPDPNQLLLISFDGFRYDYPGKVETPHFDSLAANGVQAEGLIPVVPSKTFPNHYSIVTGLYPENSGIVGNTIYDPEWDEWYRISDREAVMNGKWYQGEPIWNTLEKQGLRTGTMFWVGSEANIQGMYPTYWKPYDGSMPYRARIDTVVKWLSYPDSLAVNFATLYFEHVDQMGHDYGTDSDSVKAAIRKSDRLLGYLKNQLRNRGLWDQMNVIVLSDHGMTDLSADKTIRLDEIIDLNSVEQIIWDPMTMIWPKEGAGEQVYKALKDNEDHYQVYKKEELPERYHLKNHRRVGEIIILADLGYTILNSSNEDRFFESLPQGTHGYDNDQKTMQAIFLAHGPAFKEGENVATFQNIHIYELVNHLMRTKPASNDGSLDSVKVLLK